MEPDTEKIDRGTAKIIIEMGRLTRTQPAKINVDYPDSHRAEFVKQFSIRYFTHLNLPGVLDFTGLLLLLKNKLGISCKNIQFIFHVCHMQNNETSLFFRFLICISPSQSRLHKNIVP